MHQAMKCRTGSKANHSKETLGRHILIVLCGLLMTGCSTTILDHSFPHASEIQLSGIKEISIYENVDDSTIANWTDAQYEKDTLLLADKFNEALSEDDTFTVVTRDEKDMKKILEYVELELGDIFDDRDKAKKLGSRLGSDAFLLLDLKRFSSDHTHEKKRSMMNWIWKGVNPLYEVEERFNYYNTCKVIILVNIKIVNLTTGEVYGGKVIGKELEKTEVHDNDDYLPVDKHTLFAECIQEVANEYSKSLFTQEVPEPVPLKYGDCWFGFLAHKSMSKGLENARKGLWADAADSYEEAADYFENSDQDNDPEIVWCAHMNRAVMMACKGDFEEAQKCLDTAKNMLPYYEVGHFSTVKVWINKRKDFKEEYDEMMRVKFSQDHPAVKEAEDSATIE